MQPMNRRVNGNGEAPGDRCGSPGAACGRSAEAETATAGGVEVLLVEPVGPGALVVLLGEVARAGPGAERLADGPGVPLVPRAPRRGRDVHDVPPALLVLHRVDAVDHVAVPPDGVAGLHV